MTFTLRLILRLIFIGDIESAGKNSVNSDRINWYIDASIAAGDG